MRKVIVIAMLFLSGCFGGWGRFQPDATPGFGRRAVAFEGGIRPYYAYIPVAAPPKGGFPVVLFLHGGGESGTDPRRPTQVGLGPKIHGDQGRFPFVVLFPQCPRGAGWTSPRAEAHALAVLDDALQGLPVDDKRVYVVGNSMGGHGALLLAARHPTRFAAVVSVAGRAGKTRWFPSPPDARELPDGDPAAALASLLAREPVWLVHGEEDGITPVDESRRLGAALAAVGAEVRLTIYEGAGHAAAWERAWADPAIFTWLAAHALR